MERTSGHLQAVKKVKTSLAAADNAPGAVSNEDETSAMPQKPTAGANAEAAEAADDADHDDAQADDAVPKAAVNADNKDENQPSGEKDTTEP
eukprot:2574676-Pleurochrysis_carterae.AAC.1